MASVFHHLLAALCVADLIFLFSLVVVSPVISSSISSISIISLLSFSTSSPMVSKSDYACLSLVTIALWESCGNLPLMAVPNYSNLEYIEKLKCYFPRNGNDLEFRHHITNWHPMELYSVSPSPSSKTNVKCSMPTLKVTLGVAGFSVLIYHPYELSSLSSQIN